MKVWEGQAEVKAKGKGQLGYRRENQPELEVDWMGNMMGREGSNERDVGRVPVLIAKKQGGKDVANKGKKVQREHSSVSAQKASSSMLLKPERASELPGALGKTECWTHTQSF